MTTGTFSLVVSLIHVNFVVQQFVILFFLSYIRFKCISLYLHFTYQYLTLVQLRFELCVCVCMCMCVSFCNLVQHQQRSGVLRKFIHIYTPIFNLSNFKVVFGMHVSQGLKTKRLLRINRKGFKLKICQRYITGIINYGNTI